jgi:brefeldin A-resistance guanine nucleotide exchange factor 1
MRKYLKLQQELFLTFTIDRLAPPASQVLKGNASISGLKERAYSPSTRPGTPATNVSSLISNDSKNDAENATSSPSRLMVPPARGETRDLILETLSHISCHPSFMVDLFTNYDCDTNCDNLFERLIEFLTKV